MSNYDFTLDMETDNSNSLILRQIKPNTKILEFGPAHGRMTKYLKEVLNCEVYVVEKDEESGKMADQYAVHSWIGKEFGEIEGYGYWFLDSKRDELKFDYIIFADVLEHLVQPDEILKLSLQLLTDEGSILISIPNIGHNALLIDLLQNKFDYRETGILDKTHLRFFTHDSLKKMISSVGLTISKEINAINAVENTEFKNAYQQLPSEVSAFLKEREYGEVYQFIWKLVKTEFKLSIVIPVFNQWNFTKSCLTDLLKLDPSQVEIIIVNNASTDNTAEFLKQYRATNPNLVVINNEVNLGFGKACNIGYTNAKADTVMFLNNDIRVKNEFDSWINRVLDKCTDNNLVGPTGGKVDPNNNFQFLYETNDPKKDINYLSGWCITAKKMVWNKLIEEQNIFKGPFSEQYFCYFEDTHLSFSAKKIGIEFCVTELPVVHFGKMSSKQINTFGLYSASRSTFINNWKRK